MSQSWPRLGRRFFARPSPVVARALLGKRLFAGERAGIIVETEAYLGPDDAASHARFGPTPRNAPMFGPPGHAYVYLCYGVHELFNVVTGPSGHPQAVLVRAVELPAARPKDGRGPGKLTRALGITRRHNDVDLVTSPELGIARGRRLRPGEVAVSPRVGVDYAGDWAREPLRFFLAGHPSVSGPKRSAA